jgi:hypothetical protein
MSILTKRYIAECRRAEDLNPNLPTLSLSPNDEQYFAISKVGAVVLSKLWSLDNAASNNGVPKGAAQAPSHQRSSRWTRQSLRKQILQPSSGHGNVHFTIANGGTHHGTTYDYEQLHDAHFTSSPWQLTWRNEYAASMGRRGVHDINPLVLPRLIHFQTPIIQGVPTADTTANTQEKGPKKI